MADSLLGSPVSNFADSVARNGTGYGSADCLSRRALVCSQTVIFYLRVIFVERASDPRSRDLERECSE